MSADATARRTAADYLHLLDATLRALDVDAVLRVCALLQQARAEGRTIFLAGNGGSAATASHWANDLGKATRRPDSPPVRVMCLSDHLSWLTALANDEGYHRVFAGQLESLATPGDVLVVFSASGNSPNLVEAVHAARARGARTIAFLGFDGGALKDLVDDAVWLPTPRGAYGPVEDAHMVVCHLVTTCLGNGAAQELVRDASVTFAPGVGEWRL
jgi:D-sedoheptulose 7-phosphate isomerase